MLLRGARLLPLLMSVVLALAGCQGEPSTLVLATTTSTADSGLLDDILPPFEEARGVSVRVVAVGTGEALALGRRGDADVVMVHARSREDEFVAQGHGVNRRDVMYNDFVVLGPPADPAGVSIAGDAAEALALVAGAGREGRAAFVSRSDGSGTHIMEQGLWALAGVEPSGGWYREAGQGMGETLTVASEMLAYTLSDRGTFLAMREGLRLAVLVEGDPRLFNPYGVIAVNPERHPGVRYGLALELIEYLTAYETQERIGRFGVDTYGQPLFHPDSQEWRARAE